MSAVNSGPPKAPDWDAVALIELDDGPFEDVPIKTPSPPPKPDDHALAQSLPAAFPKSPDKAPNQSSMEMVVVAAVKNELKNPSCCTIL